eukprot:GHVO01042265.1.p1 GENE.GHVO01042265.1~~GHVO01042265.1.p1  ORF type:complete len:255 (-),score=29.59 GHVO01042265.1:128-892(-)
MEQYNATYSPAHRSESGSHAGTHRSSSSIVDMIRESIGEIHNTSSRAGEGSRRESFSSTNADNQTTKTRQSSTHNLKGEERSGGKKQQKPSVMRVTCSQVPRTRKEPDWVYPYAELPLNRQAYRGYPLDWTESLVKNGFKIQIVSPSVGEPTEPMAAFPPAVLVKKRLNNNTMQYAPGRLTHYTYPLTEAMIANNTAGSGNVSEWYYAAGLEAPPYRVDKARIESRKGSASSMSQGEVVDDVASVSRASSGRVG